MDSNALIDFQKYLVGQEAITQAATNIRSLRTATTALSKVIESDGKRIADSYAAIKVAVTDINSKGVLLNVAGSEADRQSLRQYVKDLDALKTRKVQLKEAEAGQAALLKQTTDATKQLSTATREQQAALKAAVAAGDVEAGRKYAAQLLDTRLKTEQLGRAVRGAVSEFTAVKGSYNALTLETNKLRAELRGLDTGFDKNSESANRLKKQIADNTQQLSSFDKELNMSFRNVGNYPTVAAQAGVAAQGLVQSFAGAYYGIQGVANALGQVFNANVAFSDAAADVRKTTGLTADEFDRLADSLKGIDTRTSLAGLLDIAKVGGQLGIAKEDIFAFTQAVDVAVQALGDDFTGGAEQIATELGKIASVFRKELGPDVAQNLLNIGSAVNEIGAEGAATAPFLTDVALRVGAVSAQTGVGLKNVLAYAAVLEETGFTSERAGTALNRLFSTLSTKTEAAFKIAQKANPALTLKEFTRLVNTDFNAAVQTFLKGLNAGGKTTTELNAALGTLKLQSGEAKNVIITLAQNTELFAQRQATANEQLSEGTSLAEEAAIKNDNLAGSVAKLGNAFANYFTSGGGGRFLKGLVDLTAVILDYGFGIGAAENKTNAASKAQGDYTTSIVATTKSILKQAAAQEKLLDTYTTLDDTANRSAEQELQLAEVRSKLVKQFGTTDAVAIQQRITQDKERAAENKRRLEQDLALYTSYIAGTQANTAKLQGDANAAQLAFQTRFNLTPEGQQNVQRAAASGELLNRITGRSFPREQLAAAKELNRTQTLLAASTKQLAAEQLKRAQIVAALKRLSDNVKPGGPSDEDGADGAGIEETVFNKRAKSRAELLQRSLETQLAAQLRIIDQAKKAQAELDKFFDESVINSQEYATRTAELNSRDTIITAEKNAARLRINLARATAQEQIAAVNEEFNAVKRKRNVSQDEIQDAAADHKNKLRLISLKSKAEILKIEQDLQDRLLEINKVDPLASRRIGLIPENLQRIKIGLDAENELGKRQMKRTQDDFEAEQAKQNKARERAAERRKQLQAATIDFLMQAEQAFFDFQRQRDYDRISNLEAAKDRELANAGENADLRLKIEQEYDEKIKAAKRKAAEDDKQAAIFEIVIQTAIGIAKGFADLGPIGAALAAASGAIQLALVASTPVPQYFVGREGGPAEWAEVAERGPELIAGSKGVRLAEKRGYTFLEAGADVYTADKTRELLRASAMGSTSPPQFGQSMQLAVQQLSAPTAINTIPLQDALAEQTADLIRQLKRLPAESANELIRRRGQLGNQSLDASIQRRLNRR